MNKRKKPGIASLALTNVSLKVAFGNEGNFFILA
jgi:hypothetical protein